MQLGLQLFHVHKVQSAARSQVGMIFMVAFPFQCDHLNHPNFTRPQKTTPLNQCPSILTDVNCIISWLPTAKWKLWTQSKLNQIINNNMIKHQSNAHANKSINHNLCREGNVVQMHHLYTNNSGMQYSWLRWDFFLCTEDISKLELYQAKQYIQKIYSNLNSITGQTNQGFLLKTWTASWPSRYLTPMQKPFQTKISEKCINQSKKKIVLIL